jgi:VIT1/CCC1 family predicted Fe2+/Mn2+ transporter
MTLPELKAEVHRIIAYLPRVPPRQRRQVFLQELQKLPGENEREIAIALVSTAVDLNGDSDGMRTWEKITMIASGAFFLLVILLLAVFIPDPKPFQIFAFRVVLAVAASAFGCAIPGLLHIESRAAMFTLRAGGALALALLVYAFNPPELVTRSAPDTAHHGGATNSTP